MIFDPKSVRGPTPCHPRPDTEPSVTDAENVTATQDTDVKRGATMRDIQRSQTLYEKSYSGSMRRHSHYYDYLETADEWNDWQPKTCWSKGNYYPNGDWFQCDEGSPKSTSLPANGDAPECRFDR